MTDDEQKLIAQIESAFSGVKLEDGASLNMTEYYDSGGCAPEYEKKSLGDERYDWGAIPGDILQNFRVTFCFTDLKGYRFYLPAYMIWTIRNHRASASIISDGTIYAIDPSSHQFENVPFLQWFTSDQVDAMVAFLDYAVQNDYTLDAGDALERLSKIRDARKVSGMDI